VRSKVPGLHYSCLVLGLGIRKPIDLVGRYRYAVDVMGPNGSIDFNSSTYKGEGQCVHLGEWLKRHTMEDKRSGHPSLLCPALCLIMLCAGIYSEPSARVGYARISIVDDNRGAVVLCHTRYKSSVRMRGKRQKTRLDLKLWVAAVLILALGLNCQKFASMVNASGAVSGCLYLTPLCPLHRRRCAEILTLISMRHVG
jgi:hypothetical protein